MEATHTKRGTPRRARKPTLKSVGLGNRITRELVRISSAGRPLRRQLAIEEIRSKWPDRFSMEVLECYTHDELDAVRNSARLNKQLLIEEDASDEVAGWSPDAFVDKPADVLVIADEADPARGVYEPASLYVMTSEAFNTVRVAVATLTREQAADAIRCLKPSGNLEVVVLKGEEGSGRIDHLGT